MLGFRDTFQLMNGTGVEELCSNETVTVCLNGSDTGGMLDCTDEDPARTTIVSSDYSMLR